MIASDLYFDIHVDYAARQITMSGEFDVATAPCLATAMAAVQQAAAGDIGIGLDDVVAIDPAGLSALADARLTQVRRGQALTITGVRPDLVPVFARGGAETLLESR